jgi:transposase
MNICPIYYKLFNCEPLLVEKAVIKAYEVTGNISEVARLFRATRKTVRKVLRRWRERRGRAKGSISKAQMRSLENLCSGGRVNSA